LKELGSLLYGAVIQGKVAAVLATSMEQAEQDNVGLRLRLRFSEETAELATLPWEILYDPVQERFLALSEASPILRYLSLPKARPTLLVKPPLRVLTVLASPPGYEELDLEREWQVLETALADLVADGKFVLDRLERPTFSALQERLLRDEVHILHFVGHGVYDEAAGAGALVLADSEGNAQEVGGEELATLLHNHRSLRLVYLNACEGALSSHLSVFSGVAQTLVQQGVPAAVAMQAEISDEAAIDLSRLIYSALAAGYPVDAALTQARVAIAARSAEWAIPVLFSRSPDNRLFDVVDVLPAPDCPYPGMVPFTEKQADVFFGRDKEIADAIGRLRQHPFLTVIGPSGSGKSSLVYAGVIPELRKSKRFGPGQWDVRMLRPGAKPLAALAETLQTNPENLSSVVFDKRTLLFIDQFEETFTLAEVSEAQGFLNALNSLIDQPNLYIVLTVRADFYPDLMACSVWQPIRANRLELTPLGDEELRAAILQPAAQVGVTIDEVLAERLVADAAGESGALPLVQEALVLLWEKVERRHLALSAYAEMAVGNRNGLQVAIDRRATTVYNNLPEDAQPIARRIFLRLVQFGEGRLDTRRQQTVDELRAGGDDTKVFDETLAKLTANRLLTTSGEEGSGRRVDIAHEALISGWGLLGNWIQEMRDGENVRRRLVNAANGWIASDKRGGLLDEYELHEADEWLKVARTEKLGASQSLTDLVEASRRALRRASIIRYGSLAAIVGLVVVALVGFSIFQNRLIDEQKDNATAQAMANIEIATEAENARKAEATAIAESVKAQASFFAIAGQAVVEENPLLGLRLTLEGLTRLQTITGEVDTQSVVDAVQVMVASGRIKALQTDVVKTFASPDRNTLITTADEGPGELWSFGNRISSVLLPDTVTKAFFSADSRFVVVAYPVVTAGQDAEELAWRRIIEVRHPETGSVASRLEVTREPHWELLDATLLPAKTEPKYLIVGFSARGSEDGYIQYEVYDLETSTLVDTITGGEGRVDFTSFPDANPKYISLYYQDDEDVEIRLLSDWSRAAYGGESSNLLMSYDDSRSYFAIETQDDDSEFFSTQLFETESGNLFGRWQNELSRVIFSPNPDSLTLAAIYNNGDITGVWGELLDFSTLSPVTQFTQTIESVHFSPSKYASVFVVDYSNAPGEIRNLQTGAVIETLHSSGQVADVYWSPESEAQFFGISYWSLPDLPYDPSLRDELRSVLDGSSVDLPGSVSSFSSPAAFTIPRPGWSFNAGALWDFFKIYVVNENDEIHFEVRRLSDNSIFVESDEISTLYFPKDSLDYYMTFRSEAPMTDDGRYMIVQSETQRVIAELPSATIEVSHASNDPRQRFLFAVNSGGNYLAGGLVNPDEVPRNRIFDIQNERFVELSGNPAHVDFFYSPETNSLIFTTRFEDGRVELWTGTEEPSMLTNFGIGVADYLVSKDNRWVVVRYEDGRTFVVDVAWLMTSRMRSVGPNSEHLLEIACMPFSEGLFSDSALIDYMKAENITSCIHPDES